MSNSPEIHSTNPAALANPGSVAVTATPVKDRLRAAGIHLCISLAIAAMAALLVFVVWYPYPYREISSGRELFLIVVAVDVILGPLITLAIFNRKKSRRELGQDLAVVGFIQLAALLYGLHTVYLARPVHLVFEYDRFRVVHLVEIPQTLEDAAGVKNYPNFGPTPKGLRPFKTPAERMALTLSALDGTQLSFNPALWQNYALSKAEVLQTAKTMDVLRARFVAQGGLIDHAIAQTGKPAASLRWIPMIGRKTFWTVLVDAQTAEVLGFMPLDSF